MKPATFSYTLRIQKNHLDMFGHVNNAVYLKLFEEARWDLISNNGYGIEKIQESGLGPTILEITIRFLKELRLDETIVIKTHVISQPKKIMRLSQTMYRGDELCCEAVITMALFDLKKRKLIMPTQEWLHAIGF